MTLELINDTTAARVQRYPDKSGTFAMTTDIPPATLEHYRGVDHTLVASPHAGDYTFEANGVWLYSSSAGWTMLATPPVTQGKADVLYFTSTAAGTGFEALSAIPDLGAGDAEAIITGAANTPVELDHKYVVAKELGTTSLLAGQWGLVLFAQSTDTTHTNQLFFDVGLLHADATETYLFTLTSPSIQTASVTEFHIVTVQPSYPCASTDKLLVRVRAQSSTNSVTLTWSHSSQAACSFLTMPPLPVLHNSLTDLDTGNFRHVTPAELAKLRGMVQHYRGHFIDAASVDAVTGIAGDYATYTVTNDGSGMTHDALAIWDTNLLGWVDILDGVKYWFDRGVRDARSYVGTDHNAPWLTPTAGAYTVEATGFWLYDGTTWTNIGVLKYWDESHPSSFCTKWTPKLSTSGIDISTHTNTVSAQAGVFVAEGATASGAGSVVLGGLSGESTGEHAIVLGGRSCIASGAESVACGISAKARTSASFACGDHSETFLSGAVATASGGFGGTQMAHVSGRVLSGTSLQIPLLSDSQAQIPFNYSAVLRGDMLVQAGSTVFTLGWKATLTASTASGGSYTLSDKVWTTQVSATVLPTVDIIVTGGQVMLVVTAQTATAIRASSSVHFTHLPTI